MSADCHMSHGQPFFDLITLEFAILGGAVLSWRLALFQPGRLLLLSIKRDDSNEHSNKHSSVKGSSAFLGLNRCEQIGLLRNRGQTESKELKTRKPQNYVRRFPRSSKHHSPLETLLQLK